MNIKHILEFSVNNARILAIILILNCKMIIYIDKIEVMGPKEMTYIAYIYMNNVLWKQRIDRHIDFPNQF